MYVSVNHANGRKYLVFDVVFLEEFEEFPVTFDMTHLPPVLSRLIRVEEGRLATAHNIHVCYLQAKRAGLVI